MSYRRVIPRDLFNESKLLKCLGQLALLLHEGRGVRWPLELIHAGGPFEIERDDENNALYCDNARLYLGNEEDIPLLLPYNDRSPYPLEAIVEVAGVLRVFDDAGELSEEFSAWLDDRCDALKLPEV